MTMQKILWQPFSVYQPGRDFGVYLDNNFALKMFDAKIGSKRQQDMQKIAKEVSCRFGFKYPPLIFEEYSALVTQLSIGNGGKWLATDNSSLEGLIKHNTKKPLTYHSHNVDAADEAYALLALFDHWIEYSEALIENI